MKWLSIFPNSEEFQPALERLRAAFSSMNDTDDYQQMVDALTRGQMTLYHLTDHDIDILTVIKTDKDTCFVYAAQGVGLRQVTPIFIERVKSLGFSSIEYQTYKKGMTRIIERFGFKRLYRVGHAHFLQREL